MAWTQSGSIRGASGVPGATGPQGPAGPTGATGASGGTGGTGGPGTTTWADITDKPGAILNYKGTWNVSSNSPSLSDATGSGGDVYRVSVGGSRNLGSGTISWEVGDYAIWSPVTSSWEKADTTDAVSSVAGRTGAVTLTSADLGASGTASSSTFLRGDNTWAIPSGITRSVSTITSPTTLASTANTDYVYFLSSVSVDDAAADSNWSNVKLLLKCDGTNNSTTFTDSSTSARTVTANGDAKLTTSTVKFGTASLTLDGNGDYLSIASSADFNFGSSTDFTIEAWVNPTSVASDWFVASASGSGGLFFGHRSGVGLGYGRAGVAWDYNGGLLSTGSWQHVAMCRSGSSIRLFINGTQTGTTQTSSQTYNLSTTSLTIGSQGTTNYLNGFLDDIRITTAARYTANFTAPTLPFGTLIGTPTLPTASSTSRYSFRNISSGTIIVGASGSQAINGATGGYSLTSGSTVELMSDGTGWYSF